MHDEEAFFFGFGTLLEGSWRRAVSSFYLVCARVCVCVSSVHTHLLPPEHGNLMLWGVDELLTYHYLVAEFFQTAPLSLSHDAFFALPKVTGSDQE